MHTYISAVLIYLVLSNTLVIMRHHNRIVRIRPSFFFSQRLMFVVFSSFIFFSLVIFGCKFDAKLGRARN